MLEKSKNNNIEDGSQNQVEQQQDPTTRSESKTDGSLPKKDDTNDVGKKNEYTNNKRTGNKKRKRNSGKDKETMMKELRQEKYNSLVYMATKQLNKQAKQVRTFLIQKSIRKNADKEKAKSISWKELSLDQVVYQALKQLGILHANPNPEEITVDAPVEPSSQEHHNMIQQCLAHKRFQKTLEEWNIKVTEYRRWSLQLDEKRNEMMMMAGSGKGKKGKKGRNIQESTDYVDYRQQQKQAPTSMFCSLGGDEDDGAGGEDGEEGGDWSAYGPGAMMDAFPLKKKNRKGQRQRKAKAMALEAKRSGNKEFQSLNWRQGDDKKKQKKEEKSEDGDKNNGSDKGDSKPLDSFSRQQNEGQAKASKAETVDAATAHPSWAAKKEQQTGIVAFQGTKITFD